MNKLVRILRILLLTTGIIAGAAGIYILTSLIFQALPANSSYEQAENGYEIFVSDNGAHTNIILPATTRYFDWHELADTSLFDQGSGYNYIGFGWGDSTFYINTPTWSDLSAKTAFTAMFLPTTSAMHVTYHQGYGQRENAVKVVIDTSTFITLNQQILQSFEREKDQLIRIEAPDFYPSNDMFYEARGKYHLFKTCNNWTGRTLRNSGLPAPLWPPFSFNIMKSLRNHVAD